MKHLANERESVKERIWLSVSTGAFLTLLRPEIKKKK